MMVWFSERRRHAEHGSWVLHKATYRQLVTGYEQVVILTDGKEKAALEIC